jgi:hypothetical protein
VEGEGENDGGESIKPDTISHGRDGFQAVVNQTAQYQAQPSGLTSVDIQSFSGALNYSAKYI